MHHEQFKQVIEELDKVSRPDTTIRLFVEDVEINDQKYKTLMYGGKFILEEDKLKKDMEYDDGVRRLVNPLITGATHGLTYSTVPNYLELPHKYEVEYVEETSSLVVKGLINTIVEQHGDKKNLRFLEHRRSLKQVLEYLKRSKRMKTELGNLQRKYKSLVLVPNKVGVMTLGENEKTMLDYDRYVFDKGDTPKPVVVLPNINRMGAQSDSDNTNFTKVYRKTDLIEFLFPNASPAQKRAIGRDTDLLTILVLLNRNKELIDMTVVIEGRTHEMSSMIMPLLPDLDPIRFQQNIMSYTGIGVQGAQIGTVTYIEKLVNMTVGMDLRNMEGNSMNILIERLRQEW